MYHPTTRVLAVLELLQARGRLRGAEIAARLEVDERSVRRYVTMLQDLGVPVVGERGRHGGYRLRPGFKLPPLMFSDDEALAVALGLLAARRLGLAAAAPAVEGALAKIDRVLPLAVREQVQAVQESVAFDLPAADSGPAGATVRAFGTAARQQRRLWIEYDSGRETTSRAVDPYGLVYRLGAWYAVAWCHLRQDRRVFRLERVRRVALLDETFSRPPDLDCRAYLQQALGQAPRTWSAEVLLDLTPEAARAAILPEYGSLEPAPAGVLFRCQVDSLDQLAWHLLGLSCRLVVRHPPELLEAFRRLAERAGEAAVLSEDESGAERG